MISYISAGVARTLTSQSLHPGGKYYPGGQQQAQRQQTSIPTHQDGPDGVTFGDINRPQVSPSTPDTVESIATSKAAPRDIPSASSTGAGLGEDNSLYASWNYGGI